MTQNAPISITIHNMQNTHDLQQEKLLQNEGEISEQIYSEFWANP